MRTRILIGASTAIAVAAALIPALASAGSTASTAYNQANLVSDIAGVARITDRHLVNPWGLAAGPSTPVWVADNNSNLSTLYTGGVSGSIPKIVPLVVKIPFGSPTGTVFNPTNDFVIKVGSHTGPATFIFASESGWLTAWSASVSGTSATSEFASPTGVYKGLAIGSVGSKNYVYAANFHDGTIDVFNGTFKKVTLPGHFSDPNIPPGFAPFNIQAIGAKLYVTYAKQNAKKHDDVPGPGNGFVDVYDMSGNLKTRLISHGDLNSPWGVALAPATGFGSFSGDLLVGNFGDGLIHAYSPTKPDTLVGVMKNADGNPIEVDQLWALRFGNGTFGSSNSLMFAAGIGGEKHGLLGEITAAG